MPFGEAPPCDVLMFRLNGSWELLGIPASWAASTMLTFLYAFYPAPHNGSRSLCHRHLIPTDEEAGAQRGEVMPPRSSSQWAVEPGLLARPVSLQSQCYKLMTRICGLKPPDLPWEAEAGDTGRCLCYDRRPFKERSCFLKSEECAIREHKAGWLSDGIWHLLVIVPDLLLVTRGCGRKEGREEGLLEPHLDGFMLLFPFSKQRTNFQVL